MMKLKNEQIQLPSGESFRFLQWQRNIHDIEVVAADGTRRPLRGSGHEWHQHALMELTLVDQGSGTRFIGDSITHFTAPDLVLIGPDLPHYWHMSNTSSGFAIQFDFGPSHPFWLFPETGALRSLWGDARRGIHVTGHPAREVSQLMRSSFTLGGIGRFAHFLQILQIFLAATPAHKSIISKTTFAPPAQQATYTSLQKAVALVFNNFQSDLSFADVLRELRMSKATFERHFRKHTGKTFTQFVTEVRLNYASRQLVETNQSIYEIALDSGYNNLSHFNHQFKDLHAVSPRTYRRKMETAKRDLADHRPASTRG